MVISVSPRILKKAVSGDSNAIHLLYLLFSLVQRRKHDMIIETGLDYYGNLMKLEAFTSFKETIKSIIHKSMYTNKRRFKIIVRITVTTELDLKMFKKPTTYFNGLKITEIVGNQKYEHINYTEVENYLEFPLHLLVENNKSDGGFIKRTYRLLRGYSWDENKIFVENGGGVPGIINTLSMLNRPKRYLCIIDSDKNYADDMYDKEHRRLITEIYNQCIKTDIELIVLKRKEIENYLPDQAIIKWLQKKAIHKKGHTYFTLSPEQKKFFDLKKGIKMGLLQDPNIKMLYCDCLMTIRDEDISDESKKNSQLIQGFGKDVWEAIKQVSAANQFDDDSIKEWNSIIEKIEMLM